MKRYIYFILLQLSFGLYMNPVLAQTTKVWDKTIGGEDLDLLNAATATSDGGYLLAGYSYSNTSGDKSEDSKGIIDFWIVKVDAEGSKQWDRTFGGDDLDYLTDIIQTDDGGYLLGGTSLSYTSGDKSEDSRGLEDYWIIKIDAAGNKLWDKTLGGNDSDYLTSITTSPDGGYLLGGTSLSYASGDKSEDSRGLFDYWIVKIDATGNKLWDRTFGGDDYDYLADIRQTSDGGYLLGGTSASNASGDKSEDSRGYEDYWVVKIDAAGNKQWDKTLGGDNYDYLEEITTTNDGNYLLAGYSFSSVYGDKSEENKGILDYWIIKIDAAGNKQWDKTLGGNDADFLTSITQTSDGGYLLGGYSYSSASEDKSEENKSDFYSADYWVIKINANGDKQWDKTVGGDADDILQSVLIIDEESYLLAGYSYSSVSGDKSEENKGVGDYWIVKLRESNSVNSFTLINAETDQEITILKNGDAINLAVLGDIALNFRANTYPKKIGSVKFVLDGPISHEQTENYYPYALFGDNAGKDYHGKQLALGEYSLTATPYEAINLKGKAGEPLTIHFTVTDKIAVESFTLVHADLDYDLLNLQDGDVINLIEYQNINLTIRANTNPEEVHKVKLELEGPITHVQEEHYWPYALFGDHRSEFYVNYRGRKWLPGKYTLTATPYAKNKMGTPYTISFEVTNEYQISSFSLINATYDYEIGELKDGDIINLEDFEFQKLTVSANTIPYQIDQVKFELTGPIVYSNTETYPPYALFGTEFGWDYVGLKWLPGEYTLTATPYANNTQGTPYTISFTVKDNNNAWLASEQLQIEVFPVPTSGTVNFIHEGAAAGSHMMLLDQSGSVLFTQPLSQQPIEQLDLSTLRKGLYYLKVVSKDKVQVKRIIVE